MNSSKLIKCNKVYRNREVVRQVKCQFLKFRDFKDMKATMNYCEWNLSCLIRQKNPKKIHEGCKRPEKDVFCDSESQCETKITFHSVSFLNQFDCLEICHLFLEGNKAEISEKRQKKQRKDNIFIVTFRKSLGNEWWFTFFSKSLVMCNYWSDFSDARTEQWPNLQLNTFMRYTNT